jgi:hypothetical protein
VNAKSYLPIDTTPASDRYEVERAWITAAHLIAVVTISGSTGTRCGYVGVPDDNQLFGCSYYEPLPLPLITQDQADSVKIGKKGVMIAITAGVNGDPDEHGNTHVRRSLDIVIDVHGGLTFSTNARNAGCPIKTNRATWWFGFDCNHADDDPAIQTTDYCIAECESMAAQLVALVQP